MSTHTTADASTLDHGPTAVVGRAALVGVLAGLAFGALVQFQLGRMTAIGAMYTLGDPSLTVGWIAHLFHAALFGAFFGVLVDTGVVREHATRLAPGVALGAAYATALWLVNIGLVWPLWLNAVGFGADLPVPNVAAMPLVGHLVWGVLLGAGTAIALSR
ncbi:hypothetical protein [Halorubellus sp. PRR65]|uniref:hypothetical protein n=1 Tax=Halorubellus sp. PRR65 TaxID=3098148 RepID=UPI002B261A6C|nr:hypothetical protein [Halorubellus sp. PRR65]